MTHISALSTLALTLAAMTPPDREKAEMDVFRLHEHGLWATMEKDGPGE